MEKFKAVEKEMKTKAFSKEGLSAAAKLDPKEREKLDACQFLSEMVEELERQIETLEAEEEALQATVKKGKKDSSKADRLSEISRSTERHKWHQGQLELLLRSLENGGVDVEQVNNVKDGIKYYVEENASVEFMEDDTIYDEFNLEQEESAWGITNEVDRVSSQDNQSINEDALESADVRSTSAPVAKQKSASVSEPQTTGTRRPSNQLKSPLPALATLHASNNNAASATTSTTMKPAPIPTRAPGEPLKYASAAAAAAAASDKNAVGIAPLPPPPGASSSSSVAAPTPAPAPAPVSLAPNPSSMDSKKSSQTTSPSVAPSLPASIQQTPAQKPAVPIPTDLPPSQMRSPTPSHSSAAAVPSIPSSKPSSKPSSIPPTPALETSQTANVPPIPSSGVTSKPSAFALPSREKASTPEPEQPPTPLDATQQPQPSQANGGPALFPTQDESIYHLPSDLQDLIASFEVTKSRVANTTPSANFSRLLQASYNNCPTTADSEKPRHYRPTSKYNTPSYYPQEPSPITDDHNLYQRIDTDTLFFIFYYRQGTYQQYLAAKSLKNQSWRFHKQYQTWFQRHEEPKAITEEHEQGTYRFFDYESTWYVRTTTRM